LLSRYFFYFLNCKDIISKIEINSYCKSKKYKSGPNGYQTELNWNYIKGRGNDLRANEFFNELILAEVWLIYCGENEDFKYLN